MRLQDNTQKNEDKFQEYKEMIYDHKERMDVTKKVTKEVLRERQAKMEAECQRLQMEHRNQIEAINVKTQL